MADEKLDDRFFDTSVHLARTNLEATFNPGTITAIKRDLANTPVFQSNVAIYRGNSGGPAVDRRGAVIAVSTWGHTDAEQIKFLVPVNVLKELTAAAGVSASSDGVFARHYSSALASASVGRWADAEAELAQAARLFPNSPDLARLRRDAERALKARPRLRVEVGVAALFLLLSGVGVTGWMLRRRQVVAPAVRPRLEARGREGGHVRFEGQRKISQW